MTLQRSLNFKLSQFFENKIAAEQKLSYHQKAYSKLQTVISSFLLHTTGRDAKPRAKVRIKPCCLLLSTNILCYFACLANISIDIQDL